MAHIEFIEGLKENNLPLIKLTKSKNGETGTATFIFIEPTILKFFFKSDLFINNLSLVWENQKIVTKDINIMFQNGQPFLIKGIFLFKNSKEWFNFLNFMAYYSKETGLFFSETK